MRSKDVKVTLIKGKGGPRWTRKGKGGPRWTRRGVVNLKKER